MQRTYLHTANIGFSMNDPIQFIYGSPELSVKELEFVIENECKQRMDKPDGLFELEVINDIGRDELYSNLCGCIVTTTSKLITTYEW